MTTSLRPQIISSQGGGFTSDLSLYYARGDQKKRGVFFGGYLDIAYFDYLKEPVIGEQRPPDAPTLPGEPLSPLEGRSPRDGQEPFELDFGAYVGIKGAKTTVRLSGAFSEDNGNSTDQQRQDREALRRASKDYTVGLTARREIGRGSLDGGISLQSREYSDRIEEALESVTGTPLAATGGLADQKQWDANLGWTLRPLATPKTGFRLGVGFGGSEQTDGVDEKFINPNVGVTYRYSPKTTLFGSVGAQFRRSESTTTTLVPVSLPPAPPAPTPVPGAPPVPAPGVIPPPPMVVTENNSFDSVNPTFSFGAAWNPNSTTALTISADQTTSSSALEGQSSYTTRSVTFTGTKQLPRGHYASIDYNIENSSYTNRVGDEDASVGRRGTPENYSRFGITIGRQVQLRPKVTLNMSAYYQFNVGSGDDPLSEFEQSVAGIRLGLSF
jgi:hypothetical protein